MNRLDVQTWINGYVEAWRSPGVDGLAKLFTSTVDYRVSPWKQPFHGLSEVKSFWEEGRSGYDEVFELLSEIVAIENETAVARIEVSYETDSPSKWRNLWILEFDHNGLCRSFEEWPFSPEQADGQK